MSTGINSVITICGHLTNRILCNETGQPLTLAELFPNLYQFRLKIIDSDASGQPIVVYPHITSLSASIGLVYAEPRAGTFRLRYGTGPTTVPIDFRDSPEDFRTKLAALAGSDPGIIGPPHTGGYGLDVVYQPTPSTWVCRFTTPDPQGPIPLNAYDNQLEPETFVRVREFTQNNEDWVEIRLIQGPVASTTALDSILAASPFVTTIRDGYTYDDGITVVVVDEIQAITVPPDFTGTYFVKYQTRQSIALSVNSGAQDIQTAMNNMYGDSITRFSVTNPILNNAYVEFVGPFAGRDMDPLEIVVAFAGQSDAFFQINLFTTEVAEALQRNASVAAQFEVKIHLQDPTDTLDQGQDVVLFNAPVTLRRSLHWEGLEEAAPIDWLFPPNPKDYIPFTRDQVIVGTLSYSQEFGDGLLNDFTITHDLNSSNLNVSVRQNSLSGFQLTDEEFTVSFDNNNAVTIHIVGPAPDPDSLIVVILSSGPVSAFLNHHHEIAQIINLQDTLDNILGRLTTIESLLAALPPTGGGGGINPFGIPPGSDIMTVTIPDIWNIIPTNRPAKTAHFDPTLLPTPGLLLPAIHEGTALGGFTVDIVLDLITLNTPVLDLVDGQRVRIDAPIFYYVSDCTFDSSTDTITTTLSPHNLVAGRMVRFQGGALPNSISPVTTYYVVNPTTDTFQISPTLGGGPMALLSDGDELIHSVWVSPEAPGGLIDSVDYFMVAPTNVAPTTFQLSLVPGGPAIDILTVGYPPMTMTTIADAPVVGSTLPDPIPYAGDAFSVRGTLVLPGGRGLRSETVHAGDIIASDGRKWYHVTRSDVPGSNSFYPNAMEMEIFRVAVNDLMLAPGSVFTFTFDITLQMFRHDTNVQYLIVTEWADLSSTTTPAPVGPNLYQVSWHKVPMLQQRIIVTEVPITHHLGIQVIRLASGILRANKKIYGVQVAADSIPTSANFAFRSRLIEFDTEDNVDNATGLVYYLAGAAHGNVATDIPAPAPPVP